LILVTSTGTGTETVRCADGHTAARCQNMFQHHSSSASFAVTSSAAHRKQVPDVA